MVSTKNQKKIIIAILSEAINLLQKGWCRRTLARDKSNRTTSFSGEDACKFCALGSIYRARQNLKNDSKNDPYDVFVLDTIESIRNTQGIDSLAVFNDTSKSKKKVISAFEKTKKALEDSLLT
jgi:hypothetical protein